MARIPATLISLSLILLCRQGLAAESWVVEYPRLAAQAEQDCARPPLSTCRRELQRMAALLDNRTDILYRLAKLEARDGHVQLSLGYLKSYAYSQLDLGDPAAQPEFHAMRTIPGFQQLEQVYRAGLQPTGSHSQLAIAPAPDLLAEDLALDARSGLRYLSSVHLGKVLALDTQGHWSDLASAAELSAWGIYALALDPERARLWLSSVAGAVSPPYRPADQGRSAVLRFSLNSRAVEQRYELHDGHPHAFGDMALSAGGDLYVSDGVGGGVYCIPAQAGADIETRVAPGALRSPQSPLPLPDGKRLLVADYSRGIAIVDAHRPPAVSWLRHGSDLAAYGIDGLYLHGRGLIAIQNGTVPERLLYLRLDPTFTRVLSWRVLLARAPGLGDPTHGVVREKQFEFISNSGWDRVDEQGELKATPAATGPALWSIELPR